MDYLSIGQVAHRTGLSISAIRFYESEGLVHPDRNPGGQRRFKRADIRRFSFILIAQQLGFSIKEIRDQLESLPAQRTPNRKDWEKLSRGFRKQLDHQIMLLELTRDRLSGCIGCGCLSLKRCALYNPQDSAWRHGPGPRYLLGDNPD